MSRKGFFSSLFSKIFGSQSYEESESKEHISSQTFQAESSIPEEVVSAISAAVYQMNNEGHDIESTVLTIERRASEYSPWSSKIYQQRQLPR